MIIIDFIDFFIQSGPLVISTIHTCGTYLKYLRLAPFTHGITMPEQNCHGTVQQMVLMQHLWDKIHRLRGAPSFRNLFPAILDKKGTC